MRVIIATNADREKTDGQRNSTLEAQAKSQLRQSGTPIPSKAGEARRSALMEQAAQGWVSQWRLDGTETMNLTKYRREVLWRLAEGPKTIEEARDGHPNIMPTLISNGLAHSGAGGLYELTEDGMKVVCRDALTHLAGEQGSDFSALMRAVCP